MSQSGGIFDLKKLKKNIASLTEISEKKDLWQNVEKAQGIFKKKRMLESVLKEFNKLDNDFRDLKELYSLFRTDNDENSEQEIVNLLKNITNASNKLRISTLLSGEADGNDCFIEINAGAGGTESQDWAEMLSRMYIRWIESKNFKKNIININSGEEAGIKSITIKVEGDNAFSMLKSESGVHRLVRISPFDSQKRRHTSFSSVWCFC